MTGVTIAGNTATGQFNFTDDETVEIGLAPITGTFEVVIQQGKIQTFNATPDESTQLSGRRGSKRRPES